MKNSLLLLSFLLLFSCDKKKSSESIKTVVLYSENDRIPEPREKLKIVIKDTRCPYEENRAISDIKKGNLKIYFSFLNFRKNFDNNRYRNLGRYLSKYNITLDTIIDEYSSGCVHSKDFERYCYQNTMLKEIEKSYGERFLDSLCNLVEKDYVKKNLIRTYEFTECDIVSRYPDTKDYNDMFDKSETDFFKQFQYPSGYIFKKEQYYSYTTANFILSKTGKVSNLKTEARFQNPANEKYKSYFEAEVAKFIKTVKFIPAKSCGIKVNSKMELTFKNK